MHRGSEAERLVHSLTQAKTTPARAARRVDPDVARLQEELSEHLGARVAIESRAKGAGRIVIDYASLDELDGLLAKLRA